MIHTFDYFYNLINMSSRYLLLTFFALIFFQVSCQVKPIYYKENPRVGHRQTALDAERFYASKFKAARVDGYEVFDVIRRQDKECFTQGLVFERISIDGVTPA